MSATLFRDTKYAIRNTLLKLALLFILYALYSILYLGAAQASSAYTPSAFAQTSSGLVEPGQQLYGQPTSPHTATIALNNFGHAISCILMGQSPIAPCLEYKFIKDSQGMVKSVPVLSSVNTSGGLLGMSGSALALVYDNKPLDQMSFFTYLGRNLGIVKEAHAQVPGSGNQVLSPIFALWSVSRNFAYLVMIVIFILVGLMVMFRQKLNPQTVVSVQMALPGLVIGLVLITFSYFLSALITDMAYIGTDLVGYYFDQAVQVNGGIAATQPLTESLSAQNPLTVGGYATNILSHESIRYIVGVFFNNIPGTPNLFGGWGGIFGGPANPTNSVIITPAGVVRLFSGGLTYMLYNSFLSPVADLSAGTFTIINGVLGFAKGKAPFSAGASQFISNIIGGTGTTIAGSFGAWAYAFPEYWLSFWAVILAVLIMLYTIIKLLLRLINCYLMIIFLTIASPFVFLTSSIPGRQDIAVAWMRNMLCNVLAFPAVIGVFYFAAFLVGSNAPIPGFGVANPLNLTSASGNLPFLGGLNLEFLRRIVAFVAILATPSIPDIICRTVGKPGQSGGILAGAVGGAIAGGQKYEGQISNQTQRAGADVGGWRGAMLGTKPIQAGRAGEMQMALARMRTNNPTIERTNPGEVGNIMSTIHTNSSGAPRELANLREAFAEGRSTGGVLGGLRRSVEYGSEAWRRSQYSKSPSSGAATGATAAKGGRAFGD